MKLNDVTGLIRYVEVYKDYRNELSASARKARRILRRMTETCQK